MRRALASLVATVRRSVSASRASARCAAWQHCRTWSRGDVPGAVKSIVTGILRLSMWLCQRQTTRRRAPLRQGCVEDRRRALTATLQNQSSWSNQRPQSENPVRLRRRGLRVTMVLTRAPNVCRLNDWHEIWVHRALRLLDRALLGGRYMVSAATVRGAAAGGHGKAADGRAQAPTSARGS